MVHLFRNSWNRIIFFLYLILIYYFKGEQHRRITSKNNHGRPFAVNSERSSNYKRTLYNSSGRRAHTMCAKRRCGLSALLCSRRPQITCTIMRSQRREKEKLGSELRSRALLELARCKPSLATATSPFQPPFSDI